MSQFSALGFHADPNLTETVRDWSGCRSKSRAMRRAKQGHKQRDQWKIIPSTKCYRVDGKVYMHPERLKALVEYWDSKTPGPLQVSVVSRI